MSRSSVARDLRSPKYRKRVVADRRKKASKRACRVPSSQLIPANKW